jgi:hypothetical protein
VSREDTAVHEANLKEIPVIALVDTNCDPRGIDYVIPSNDDAIRAIKLLVSKVADAVLEGRACARTKKKKSSLQLPAKPARPLPLARALSLKLSWKMKTCWVKLPWQNLAVARLKKLKKLKKSKL